MCVRNSARVLAASHAFEVSRSPFLIHRAAGDRGVGVDLGVAGPDAHQNGVEFVSPLAGTQADRLILENAA